MKKKETITQKIRDFISDRPNVTMAEIEEMLGFTSRSIKTMAGYQYKKMYGHTIRNATVTKRVVQFFKENPNATVKDATKALSLERNKIYYVLSRKNIQYRREQSQDLKNGPIKKIHDYAVEHPFATPTEYENALKVNKNTVNRAVYSMREKGIIPRRMECVSRVLTPLDIKAVNELIEAGYTDNKIAKMFNVDRSAIKRCRKFYTPANDEFEDMGVTGI